MVQYLALNPESHSNPFWTITMLLTTACSIQVTGCVPGVRGSNSQIFPMSTTPLAPKKNGLVGSSAVVEEWKKLMGSAAAPGLEALLTNTKMDAFWRRLPAYEDVEVDDFLDYKWQMAHTLRTEEQVAEFVWQQVPDVALAAGAGGAEKQELVNDVVEGMRASPMSVSLTPYLLSCMDWTNFPGDPLRKQFLSLRSQRYAIDHPMLQLDSLAEQSDSPVPGIVHRYPRKALFLATSVCPIYCRFCTRSYSVGPETDAVTTKEHFMPNRRRWQNMFDYIIDTPNLEDVLVSGGDSFFLTPDDILYIGDTLLSIPHVRRIRFATRGLTAAPMRFLSDKRWTQALFSVVEKGRSCGKFVSLQVHFNHPNEITWITALVAFQCFARGLTMRNQSPLLRGVNDDVATMFALIHKLASLNIQPYYVYQGDMVKGVEDLRTPLSTILHMEREIQGTISGYYTPKFIIDLPNGGGKRLACSLDHYDRLSGVSKYTAPAVKKGLVFHYYDPLHALSESMQQKWLHDRMPH